MRSIVRWSMALLLPLAVSGVLAQEKFPSKPIQLVVPLPPGTTSDQVARTFGERLSVRMGVPVLVQNRPGAGGSIAAQSVVKSAPDGYTILIVNSQHAINPALYKNLPYDTQRDLTGIALFGEAPSLIVVHPKVGVKTLQEFVALAKQKPGQLNYGSSGVGTTTHLGGAHFAARAGIDLVHVPYKGSELLTDMVGGRLDAMFVPVAFLLQHIREGRLIALGVTSAEPLRSPIEVPSVAEAAGLPGYEYSTFYGFVAPAKTPPAILEQLARDIRATNNEPELRKWFTTQAIFQRDLGPAEFDQYIRANIERIGALVKAVGATAN